MFVGLVPSKINSNREKIVHLIDHFLRLLLRMTFFYVELQQWNWLKALLRVLCLFELADQLRGDDVATSYCSLFAVCSLFAAWAE